MDQWSAIEKARYIFSTGKLIRDRIFKVAAGHGSSGIKNGGFGDMSLAQIHTINVTRERGQVSIKELSEILSISPPSASSMVNRLVEKGYLTREPCREDRRKVVVKVSPKAIAGIDEVEKDILHSFIDLVENIGPEVSGKWCEVLQKVKEVQDQNK
jgi:DNA-binding MarR family transcriptional regulator